MEGNPHLKEKILGTSTMEPWGNKECETPIRLTWIQVRVHIPLGDHEQVLQLSAPHLSCMCDGAN